MVREQLGSPCVIVVGDVLRGVAAVQQSSSVLATAGVAR